MTANSDRAALEALASSLRRHGYTVVPNGNEVEVRLSLLVRVRVTVLDGALRCTTYFGLVERSRAAILTIVAMEAVTIALLLSSGITPLAIAVGFLGVMAGIHECLRFLVSEGALGQIHQRWSELTRPSVHGELPSGERWMEDLREAREAEAIKQREAR